jgi:MFS family permease
MSPQEMRRMLPIFFGGVLLVAAAMGLHESVFNNFLSDTFDLSADHRGVLEFPRELPGFLVVVMAGILAALPVTRLGVVGAGVMTVGLLGMALLGRIYWPMVAMMILTSAGMHLFHPVETSIAIGLSGEGSRGRRIGQLQAVGTIGTVLGAGFVWWVFDPDQPQYRLGFVCAAALVALAGLVYARLYLPHMHQPRSPLVFRRKYGLYYVLELLFGARKQIFLTFGPWVLIRFYGEPPTEIARLFMIAAFIGIVFKPLAGMMIDWLGERTVLVVDALVLAVVCIGYGYAYPIAGDMETARQIACACFVLDNLLFSLGAARAVYVSRLTDSPQEITSTLSMGISINHIASMTIPFGAGLVWARYDHEAVFAGAAVLALIVAGASSFVPGRARLDRPV